MPVCLKEKKESFICEKLGHYSDRRNIEKLFGKLGKIKKLKDYAFVHFKTEEQLLR